MHTSKQYVDLIDAYIKYMRYLLNLKTVKLQKNYYNIARVDVSKIPTVS